MTQPTYASVLATLYSTPTPLLPRPSITPIHPTLPSAIASLQLHPTLEALLHIMNGDLASAHFLVRHMQRPVPPPRQKGQEREKEDGEGGKSVWMNGAKGVDDMDGETNGAGKSGEENGAGKSGEENGAEKNGEHNGAGKDSKNQKEAPRIEGMHLHALLHRLEGDYDNAAAWYKDVASYSPPPAHPSNDSSLSPSSSSSDDDESTYAPPTTPPTIFTSAFPSGLSTPLSLLSSTSTLKLSASRFDHKNPASSFEASRWYDEKAKLEKESQTEIERVRKWLEGRYGSERWREASEAFVGMGSKHGELASKMIMGGEGWRQF